MYKNSRRVFLDHFLGPWGSFLRRLWIKSHQKKYLSRHDEFVTLCRSIGCTRRIAWSRVGFNPSETHRQVTCTSFGHMSDIENLHVGVGRATRVGHPLCRLGHNYNRARESSRRQNLPEYSAAVVRASRLVKPFSRVHVYALWLTTKKKYSVVNKTTNQFAAYG